MSLIDVAEDVNAPDNCWSVFFIGQAQHRLKTFLEIESMSNFEELSILRELVRMRDDPARAKMLWRWAWTLAVVAVLLLSVVFAVNARISVKWQRDLCVGLAFLSGAIFGGGFWYAMAARQLPLIVRYTDLRTDEILGRIDELSSPQAPTSSI